MISVLSQLLKELKKKNEELEKERLANVPMDTAKEIKNLQNKIVSPLLLSIQYVNVGGLSLVAVTHLPKTFISEAKGCSVYNSNSLKSGFVFFCSVCLCFLLLFVFVFFCCVCLCFLLLWFFVFVCCVCLCFRLLCFFVFVCSVCLCFHLLCFFVSVCCVCLCFRLLCFFVSVCCVCLCFRLLCFILICLVLLLHSWVFSSAFFFFFFFFFKPCFYSGYVTQ